MVLIIPYTGDLLQNDKSSKRFHFAPGSLKQITGYEYEFLECRDRLQGGFTESTSMPMDETVFVMEIMDQLRRQWNLAYPADEEDGQQKA